MKVWFYFNDRPDPLAGLCEVLEEMAGHNVLEALSLEVVVSGDPGQGETEDFIGSAFQKVEEALVNPGSSGL